MARAAMVPDPWQVQVLASPLAQVLLLCSRQVGKSTVAAALAMRAAILQSGALTLLLSPSQRQSGELFRKVLSYHAALGQALPVTAESVLRIEFANGSRIVSLPGDESTIRGYSGVALLVIDEAARVDDNLYRAVRPMLAVSRGRLVALSTPFGHPTLEALADQLGVVPVATFVADVRQNLPTLNRAGALYNKRHAPQLVRRPGRALARLVTDPADLATQCRRVH
jgi:hypothetical protein